MKLLIIIAFVLAACQEKEPVEKAPESATTKATLTIKNSTSVEATVYVSFGADSAITADTWKFCTGSGLNCSFKLAPSGTQSPDLEGKYLNATMAFNKTVACGSTKAEMNLNNPKWYDVLDVSLVDGYSNNIKITADETVLGPPKGKDGNEKVLGVFPYGCDICTGRQSPPCGIEPGGAGCKAGTQNDPKPPCQWQGTVRGGGTKVLIELVD